jgi:hypothetical protein
MTMSPKNPSPKHPAEQDPCAELAQQVAELESRQADQERTLKVQSALYEITDAASAVQDMGAFYAELHRVVGGLMYAKNFFIALYDETTGLIEAMGGRKRRRSIRHAFVRASRRNGLGFAARQSRRGYRWKLASRAIPGRSTGGRHTGRGDRRTATR